MYRLDDVNFMTEALRLAASATALASPNPRVGAIVVQNGIIVGRGFHQYATTTHAEVLALAEAGGAAVGATLYINLEPCCHTGRTPPCTAAVLQSGIARVVVAMADPNPLVAGAGLRQLAAAGVATELGCMQREARQLNEDFSKWIRTGLPFITLKAAVSLDGRIAPAPLPPAAPLPGAPLPEHVWISSATSRDRVQLMRHERDAVLTGSGTVAADNPWLTDRTKKPRRRPLLRVVLESDLRLDPASNLAQSARRQKGVLVYCLRAAPEHRKALEKLGVMVRVLGAAPGAWGLPLEEVLRELGHAEVTSLLLEAGSRLNAAMLNGGWVDKLVLFQAPRLLGQAAVPLFHGLAADQPRAITGKLNAECVGADVMIEAYLDPVPHPAPPPCSPESSKPSEA